MNALTNNSSIQLKGELPKILKHAGSVLAGQLAVMAFGVADTLIAGRYSDTALAALSVGSALYVSVYVGLMGIVQALLPIWSEMLGAGQTSALGRSIRQSLYLCGLITLVGMAALLLPGQLLVWADVPPALQTDVKSYLAVLACALAPSLLFRIYGTFNQSLGKPLMVTWLQVAALVLKIPLSIWFVSGGAGLEPMGVVGCAWATLIVNYALVILAVVMLRTQAMYQPFQLWHALEPPDWPQIGRFLRLGLPGGLAYLVEVTSFTLMALFIARLGTTASAGHQIAASVATVLYMVPLSLAIASSARVSFWIGSGHPSQAKHVVFMTLRLLALISLALSAIIFTASHQLASWYSTNPKIIESASSLLIWVAFYHVADSTQAVSAFLLRCYRITLAPLAIYGVLLWGLGLWGGYQLTYHGVGALQATQQALSFWVASTVAIVLVALALVSLLLRAVYGSQRPAVD